MQLLKNYAKSLQKAEFRGEAQPEVRVSQRPKDQKQDVDNAVKNEIFEAVGQVAVLQKNVKKGPQRRCVVAALLVRRRSRSCTRNCSMKA